MDNTGLFVRALQDFKAARRKAALQEILGRLTKKPTELLSYEEVRQKLRASESNVKELKEIPVEAIIGSVGRYTDFTRDFLPRREIDQQRWARIMAMATGLSGLPPIEVYQIGEVYFVLDGNHRVSVARQLETPTIEAYVRKIRTRVNITPDTQPDDLIMKAEQLEFLEQTQLDHLRPNADLTVTNPGQYPILLEHIAVHQYFMGLDEGRDITYREAVTHWYDAVYAPVIQIIREQGILRHFPGRTETDLYLWISKHRADLEDALGWSIEPEVAAADWTDRFSPELSAKISRLTSSILDAVTPDALESGPSPGTWRQEATQQPLEHSLFANTLVAISERDRNLLALDQAIVIARRESGRLHGLHILKRDSAPDQEKAHNLASEFQKRCQEEGVEGQFVIESGSVARVICERARWSDLIVSKLSYPPGDSPLGRLSSGIRTLIRRCPRPILVVPDLVTSLDHALLAYNGTPKAEEALFVGTYLGAKWNIKLNVLVIQQGNLDTEGVQKRAREYLRDHNVEAEFILHEPAPRAETILKVGQELGCDLILMGGYKAKPLVEVVLGSIVDEVLRKTQIPMLICR